MNLSCAICICLGGVEVINTGGVTSFDAIVYQFLRILRVCIGCEPVSVAEDRNLHTGVSEVAIGHLLALLFINYSVVDVLSSEYHLKDIKLFAKIF